jgi:tripartite-type tricarboxylate transporter receptor subunit TctC
MEMLMATRRRVLMTLAATAIAGPAVAEAQDFPSKAVTLIVPFSPGGATDVVLRALARSTEKHLGQPIVIENRPGAAATVGPAQMARAKPDGYTIASIALTVFRLPFMRKATYDPVADFTYIIGVAGYTYGVVVRSDSPWKTFQEFLADARANPDKIDYGTSGHGSTTHITMEQVAKQAGAKFVHVPFKGAADGVNALLGGHIQAQADTTTWAPQVNSGDFRLLVTFGAQRTKHWPDVPTLREFGFDMVANSSWGLAGPKGMDPKVVKTLHDAFKLGMEEPDFVAVMENLDQENVYLNSEDYRKDVLRQISEQKQIVEEFGLKQ